MPPFGKLVACPACHCHAKPDEIACPHCGATLRRPGGAVPRTAVAVLLGLSTFAACEQVDAYGPAPSGGDGGYGSTSSTSSSSSGGPVDGGAGGQDGGN